MSRFLSACRMEPVDTTPIWMMRQAGRSLPAYRELRSKYTFLELTRQPELMASITLMPFEYFDADAAVAFADIMLPLASLGVDFEIVEASGPQVEKPIRQRSDVERLTWIPLEETVPNVFRSIEIASEDLGPTPLIGFSGAPFTLACYLVEGKASRDFNITRSFMLSDPVSWAMLMERLTDLVIEYLKTQIRSGARAVQLFDSWVGVLSPQEMQDLVLPYTRRVFESLADDGVPRIYFGTHTASFIELQAETDCDVIGVDWRTPLDQAWSRISHRKGIQGNLDPAALTADSETVKRMATEVLRRAEGRDGHIFNLGHGVLPDTPLENLQLLIDFVHEHERTNQ